MIYGHSPEVYGLRLITPPDVEPITLTDAKLHLRVDLTNNDDLIKSLIVAAREFIEVTTGRALITQTWEMTTDSFPYPRSYMTGTRPVGGVQPEQRIRVPKPNLQSVTSIVYLDSSGSSTTLDPSQYVVDETSLPGQIAPAFGVSWPYSLRVPGSVVVRFVCGYGLDDAVPDGLKAAIKLLIGGWYEHRESIVDARFAQTIPFTVDALLGPYRVMEAA